MPAKTGWMSMQLIRHLPAITATNCGKWRKLNQKAPANPERERRSTISSMERRNRGRSAALPKR
jgi:hypothetical protein